MAYDVTIIEVPAQALAVVRRRATLSELAALLTEAFDQVWDFLGEHKVVTGHNVVLYLDQVFNLEVGVQVMSPLPAHESIIASETPAGRVATTTHFGPYEDLTLAHTAIARSVIGGGLQVAGPNWEVYGDWDEDPEKLRTDVYYLLK